jgi:hypothetical protein
VRQQRRLAGRELIDDRGRLLRVAELREVSAPQWAAHGQTGCETIRALQKTVLGI